MSNAPKITTSALEVLITSAFSQTASPNAGTAQGSQNHPSYLLQWHCSFISGQEERHHRGLSVAGPTLSSFALQYLQPLLSLLLALILFSREQILSQVQAQPQVSPASAPDLGFTVIIKCSGARISFTWAWSGIRKSKKVQRCTQNSPTNPSHLKLGLMCCICNRIYVRSFWVSVIV